MTGRRLTNEVLRPIFENTSGIYGIVQLPNALLYGDATIPNSPRSQTVIMSGRTMHHTFTGEIHLTDGAHHEQLSHTSGQ